MEQPLAIGDGSGADLPVAQSAPPAGTASPQAAGERQRALRSQPLETKFPLARIRKVLKANDQIKIVASDAVAVAGVAVEQFLGALAKDVAALAKSSGRKTATKADFIAAIQCDSKYFFLSDLLL